MWGSFHSRRCSHAFILLAATLLVGAWAECATAQNIRSAKQSLERRKSRVSSRYDIVGPNETLIGVRLPSPWDTAPPQPNTREFAEAQSKAWEILIRALFPSGAPAAPTRKTAIPTSDAIESFQSVPNIFRLYRLMPDAIPWLRSNPNILFVSNDPGIVKLDHWVAKQNPISNPRQINLDNPGEIPFTDIRGVTQNSKVDIDIDTVGAWPWTIGKSDVVIAIIDDNFDLTRPELKEGVYLNTGEIPCNDIDDDGNGYVDDANGYHVGLKTGCVRTQQKGSEHGTSMALTISAPFRRPSEESIVGIAPGARFLPISLGSNFSKLDDAYEYVLNMKKSGVPVRVVNLSLGFSLDPSLSNISKCSLTSHAKGLNPLGKLLTSDITIVTAAGNDGRNNDTSPVCPANYASVHSNVITVAAVDHAGNHPFFSNFGRTSVTTSAPGSAVYTGYGYSTGTSVAAAQVSGIAALIYSREPTLAASKVKEIIIQSTKHTELDLPTQTRGIVDAVTALKIASGRASPTIKKPPL